MNTRRFWQIHLSTVLALVLMVAMLLWGNLRNHPAFVSERGFDAAGELHQGWPLSFRNITVHEYIYDNGSRELAWQQSKLATDVLIADVVVCVVLLVLTLTLVEWRARRRKARP